MRITALPILCLALLLSACEATSTPPCGNFFLNSKAGKLCEKRQSSPRGQAPFVKSMHRVLFSPFGSGG